MYFVQIIYFKNIIAIVKLVQHAVVSCNTFPTIKVKSQLLT
jgi:hypothetical protein